MITCKWYEGLTLDYPPVLSFKEIAEKPGIYRPNNYYHAFERVIVLPCGSISETTGNRAVFGLNTKNNMISPTLGGNWVNETFVKVEGERITITIE